MKTAIKPALASHAMAGEKKMLRDAPVKAHMHTHIHARTHALCWL